MLGLIPAVITVGVFDVGIDPDPLQVPPELGNIYRWHRAEPDNMVTSSGDLVDTWLDLSGHGNDLTAVTTGRPIFIASTGSFNNQSVVSFDGVNDHMDDTHAAISSSAVTFGIIFKKIDQVGLVDGILSFRNAAGNDFDQLDAFNYNTGRASPTSTNDEIESSTGIRTIFNAAQTAPGYVTIRLDTADNTIRQIVNGVLRSQVSKTMGDPTWDLVRTEIGARNGNSQQFRGDYLELIVYQGGLTNDQMFGLDNYLSSSLAGTLSGSV